MRKFVFILSFALLCESTITFLSPPDISEIELPSAHFIFIGSQTRFNVTNATAVAANPFNACHNSKISKNEFVDKFVIVSRDDCSPGTKFRNVQKGSPLGIIFLESPKDLYELAGSKYLDGNSISIGGLEVKADTQKHYDIIRKALKDGPVLFSATSDNFKRYEEVYIPFSVIIGLCSIFNIAFGLYKLKNFVQISGRLTGSLAECVLIIEVVGNFERLLFTLEPSTGIGRGILDYQTINVLVTLSVPWAFITTLLVAFFWDHTLQSFSRRERISDKLFSLEKWKVPLALISLFLVGMDLASIIVRVRYLASNWMPLVTIISYGIIALGIALFFTINGYKILNFLNSSRSQTKRSQALRRLTYYVIINAAVLFAMGLLGALLGGLDPKGGVIAVVWIVFVGLSVISFLQISIFQPESQDKPSESVYRPSTEVQLNTI